VTYVETGDPSRLLGAAGAHSPLTASVAVVDANLGARVFAGVSTPVEVPHGSPARPVLDQTSILSMLLVRYPDPKAAGRVAAQWSKGQAHNGAQIELVIETDGNGRRRVSDPTRGTAAWARSDVISWGLFGLVFGALVGAIGGGGLHGLVDEGLVTGTGWAVFGLFAGALYGLWAGRSISARRLNGIGPILAPGTSAVLAWADGAPRQETLDALTQPGAHQLVLQFDPVGGGAVLEAV
jgi:hypothetical protein